MSIEFVLVICLFAILFTLQRLIYKKQIQNIRRELSKESKEDMSVVSAPLKNTNEEKSLKNEIEKLKATIEDTKIIAQDATMIKSDFLTNIRHEIRTPMNSILVFSQMIEKESNDANLMSYANSIFKSSQNLLHLLNNIIEMSEIDSGSFKIQTNAIDVKKFIDTVVEVHKYEASKKGLHFSIDMDSLMPESIMIDETRVKEILDNLLENALKFTQVGEIKLIVTLDDFNEAKHEADILFKVQDTGLGILKINQEKIFKMFENKEVNHKPEYQGTGLGLSINRKLANLMNGSLEVVSELQEGATFTLSLREVEVVLVSKNEDINESDIDFSVIKEDSKILLIDDSQNSIDVIKDSFIDTKVEVFALSSSKEAIPVLQNNKVDLIIINADILSVDDGAVAKVIRKVSNAPVVSLVDDRLKGINFHENGVKPISHLKKPLRKVDLFRVLLKIINLQDMLVENGKIQQKEAYEGFSFKVNEEASREYFKQLPKEMDDLLAKALSTNDLNVITRLAKGMHQLSLIYKVKSLTEFSKKLLAKIDAFDIVGIDTLLKEYERKSKEFR